MARFLEARMALSEAPRGDPAHAVGVTRQTIHTWRTSHLLFQSELEQARGALWCLSAERLRGLRGGGSISPTSAARPRGHSPRRCSTPSRACARMWSWICGGMSTPGACASGRTGGIPSESCKIEEA
jgi:hypothetical protein